MSALALALVLAAAIAHAAWNCLAKKIAGGIPFIWLFAVLSAVLYSPVAAWIYHTHRPEIGLPQLGLIAGTAVLHVLYFILLDKGYQLGDLSVIYPLARGTGPLLAMLAAVLLLGERPSWLAVAGGLAIGAGILVLTGNPAKLGDPANRRPVVFALLCGAVIAAYTVWDKIAVSAFLIPPLLYDWAANLGRVLILTPAALRDRQGIRDQWRRNKLAIAAIAVLSPLAYILVLTAMVFSPVSYIAPAREISILIGTLAGARILREGHTRQRLAVAGVMVAGLVALALG
ncbi:EamA family transporter [Anaeroselena agilis]|uniref:DMT family transporter n=1 Tax=Anaeroselena agilis TaxID=3063788 RepID=A0ABU3NZB1_9FIRM|nr:DMT family transporter [Selenomonadales bacterium 4137-cl]